MSFSQFVCWTRQAVADTIVIDAATPFDSVFLATHHPCFIYKREVGSVAGGQRLTERQVLKELLSRKADPLLLPIIGASGSGKSHLVRWLRAELGDGDPARHVVYVPKFQTSLRGVIETIIEGFEGPEFLQIRKDLSKATEGLHEDTAPVELLNRLAQNLETWKPSETDPEESPATGFLAGRDGLAVLLYEHGFREHLLAEDGVIQRFVRQAIHGKNEADEGEPYQFEIGDLPIGVVDIGQASQKAQEFYDRFSDDAELQDAAVRALNRFLHTAVRDLIGVKADQLGRLFRRVRELLGEDDQELILLIEDFSVLQGIQRELLDELLVPSAQMGKRLFCRLRTAMAVTEGYFNKLLPLGPLGTDTVRTRARFVYSLDVPLEELSEDDLESFVGRYLNAARLGAERIENAHTVAGLSKFKSWIPNHCDSCDHQEACLEAFGSSKEKYGLYPFNRLALRRAVESKLRKFDGRFDPREILSGVLLYTLNSHLETIRAGEFPNEHFQTQFENPDADFLPTSVEWQIQQSDKTSAERRIVLLTFWGDAPQHLKNLNHTIHEAFRLELLRDIPDIVIPPIRPPKPNGGGENAEAQLRQRLNAIRKWRRTVRESLPQELARDLRKAVHEAVVQHMDWERLTLHPEDWTNPKGAFSHGCIHFDSEGKGSADRIHLALDRGSTEDVQALEALLQFEHHGNWRFDEGGQYYRVLRRRLDSWSSHVEEKFLDLLDGVHFENSLHALCLGAAALGLEGADSDDLAKILNAALQPVDLESFAALAASDDSKWTDLQSLCVLGIKSPKIGRQALIERVFEHVGTSKGRSGPQALDAERLVDCLRERLPQIEKPPATLGKDAPSKMLARILKALDKATQERRERLRGWLDEVSDMLGEEVCEPGELVSRLREAIGAAARVIIVDPIDERRVESAGREFVQADPQQHLANIAEFLEMVDSLNVREQLSAMARVSDRELTAIKSFLNLADRVVDNAERQIELLEARKDTSSSALEHAVEDFFLELDQMAKTLDEISAERSEV